MNIEHMNAENHNLMDDPVMADKALKANPKWEEAITKIGDQIVASGLQDVLSVRLIHRHHTIDPGQLMVERTGKYKGGTALITEVQHERDSKIDQLLPNVLAVTEDGYGVTEYCITEVIADPDRARSVFENQTLLRTIREIILDNGLEKYVGIGLCNKPFFDLGREDGILLEITDVDEMSNVIRWVPRKREQPRSIQTLWKFEDPKAVYNNSVLRAFCSWGNHGGGGGVSCLVYCYVICEQLSPGHAETHERPHAPNEY